MPRNGHPFFVCGASEIQLSLLVTELPHGNGLALSAPADLSLLVTKLQLGNVRGVVSSS